MSGLEFLLLPLIGQGIKYAWKGAKALYEFGADVADTDKLVDVSKDKGREALVDYALDTYKKKTRKFRLEDVMNRTDEMNPVPRSHTVS